LQGTYLISIIKISLIERSTDTPAKAKAQANAKATIKK